MLLNSLLILLVQGSYYFVYEIIFDLIYIQIIEQNKHQQHMIGVVIGVVFSAVIFTVFTKDQKAVNQHKEKKKIQEQKKKKAEQQQKQAIQKMRNDPQLKKKREQNEKKMRQKLFQGVSESDKKLLQDYLQSKKNSGKSQAQIIKDATGKAGIFVIITLIFVFVLIFAFIAVTSGGDFSNLQKQATRLLTAIYPRYGEPRVSDIAVKAFNAVNNTSEL